jgi:hypothetical protein
MGRFNPKIRVNFSQLYEDSKEGVFPSLTMWTNAGKSAGIWLGTNLAYILTEL